MSYIESTAERTIRKYFDDLSSLGYKLTEILKQNYHFEFMISREKEKVKLQVYFGKKGIKNVLQGDQNSTLYKELYAKFNSDLFPIENKELNEPSRYIGTDESGKGDYFGPLIVAGVLVDNENIQFLKALGVKDSKELSDSAIKKLSLEIRRNRGIKFNVISISPKKYNDFYTKVGNVNRILGWAHAKVIENLLEKDNNVEEAISDKFGDEKYIYSSLQEKGQNITLHQVTKAERYTAVAAASIIARDSFNSWFIHEKLKLGFDLPKGASESCEAAAEKVMSKIGNHSLKDFVKLHFKNTLRLKTNI
jgi:ribonuclease HIII